MSKENIKKQLISFINKYLPKGTTLKDDTHLYEQGILNSLAFVELLVFIKKNFKLHIEISELTSEEFSTLQTIVETIYNKQNG